MAMKQPDRLKSLRRTEVYPDATTGKFTLDQLRDHLHITLADWRHDLSASSEPVLEALELFIEAKAPSAAPVK